MISLVERGADEVVHSGIDDLEGFGRALFLVKDLGEKDAGVSGGRSPRAIKKYVRAMS